MASYEDNYFSIKLTRFFMKVVGLWNFKTHREELLLNIFLAYTVLAVLFAIAVEAVDLFYSWGDFNAVTYNACATMPLVVVLVKITVFIIRRDVVLNLINFSEKNFWKASYDNFGKQIMRECETKGVFMIFTFTFLVSGTVFNYLLAPIVENIGRNDTERILPFKLWVDLPLSISPYFEITFTIQSLSTIHSGICFFCFDNLMCIFAIHIVGQFKILQNRFKNVCEIYSRTKNTEFDEWTNDTTLQFITYDEFKSCVNQHTTLINYIEKLESVFTFVLLPQMLVSSLLLCLSGFQVFMAKLIFVRRLIFISHIMASFTQLLLFTWTCNEIIIHSVRIGDALYHSEWYSLPHRELGISLKRGLLIVMARVRRPCFLSAGKFCPMSLQAFTSILSTAVSYFTLLRQMSEELDD